MKIRRLFALRSNHEAYPDGRCPDLRITPRSDHPSGERALARFRLLARERPHGLEVVAQVDDGADVFASAFPVDEPPVFGFDVHVDGSEFAALTNLDAWAGLEHRVYRGGPEGGPLQLVDDGVAHRRRSTSAAVVEIVGITPDTLDNPVDFTLEFSARRALWVYYVLTARAGDQALKIVDAAAAQPVAFVREQLTLANTSAAADATGRRLLERHPDLRCHRFRSQQPLPVRGARRELALLLGDEELIHRLPAPSIHNFALLTIASEAPRQALVHVIEC